MSSAKKLHISWYILSDYVAAIIAWIILYFTRRYLLEETITTESGLYLNNRFWWGLVLIPLGWLIFYSLVGAYTSLYNKSRLTETSVTLICSLIGCTVIFFLIVINDPQHDYTYYYKAHLTYLTAHFLLTILGRWIILSFVKKQLQKGSVRFNTLLIGSKSLASKIYADTAAGLRLAGYHYIGYVSNGTNGKNGVPAGLPYVGDLETIESIIDQRHVDLV
ncbi:MAG TPA: hypothetical protein VD996_07275, partial [Chitinophagaceae bacterium]|nr:hypothetical protein [Chitinophagaceae bacterium]